MIVKNFIKILGTFSGSTHRSDSKKDSRKEESHSSDFACPHSMLYSNKKKAEERTDIKTINQAIRRTQWGRGSELFSSKCSKLIFCSFCVDFSPFSEDSMMSVPELYSEFSEWEIVAIGFFFFAFFILGGVGRLFRNAKVINITGGVVIDIPMTDTIIVVTEILITPTCQTPSTLSSSEDRKNIAFVIIVRKSRDNMQERRWTRVKILLWGLINIDSHKCCSVMFDWACSEKSVLKDVISSLLDTGRILSIIPSSSSMDSHLSHKKMYLKQTNSYIRIIMHLKNSLYKKHAVFSFPFHIITFLECVNHPLRFYSDTNSDFLLDPNCHAILACASNFLMVLSSPIYTYWHSLLQNPKNIEHFNAM